VGGKGSGTRFAHLDFAAHPGSTRFDGAAWSLIVWRWRLKVREHMLGTIGGPQRQQAVVVIVELGGLLNHYRVASRLV
jgi:hypothetical protein